MLFRNTLAQSGSTLIGYLFSFILAPIMIGRLGLDAFGVWAVTGAFAMYAGLLDLGIGRSLSRFVAVYEAEGDHERIPECVGLGVIAVLLVGCAAAAAAAAAAPFLSDRLGVLDAESMRVVVLSAVAIWTLNGIDGVMSAVGIGMRRMVPPNVAGTVGISLNFAFSLAALALSSELELYALANAAAAAAGLVPSYFALRYVWEGRLLALPRRSLVYEVLGFSIKNQVGWLADLVNLQTDKVVIALMIDVRAAAAYEIASRVVMAVRSTAILTISAMIPTAAARIVSEGHEVIRATYGRHTLRTCAIAFPLFVAASVTAPFLLIGWLGSAPAQSELLVPLLTSAYLVNITTGVGTSVAVAAGDPGLAASNAVQIAVLNVLLTVALAPLLGLWGVALGTFVAVSAGSILFNVRFMRKFNLPWRRFLAAVLKPGALALGLGIAPALLALAVGVPSGRAEAVPLLALSLTLYLLPYWLIATRQGFLPAQLEFRPLRRAQAAAPPS
jgi:O-antigen/teichoic acid export membrane protein